jgi:DNA-directed RNA polymerase specialized sigma24 family protein
MSEEPLRADAGDLRRSLDEVLKRLGLEIRASFLLATVSGFGHREIAVLLGMPPGVVPWNIQLARREIQAFLKKEWGGRTE